MPGKIGARSILLILGVAGGSGLLAVWAASGGKPLLSPAPERAPASASESSLHQDASHFFLPKAGRRYVYSFERMIAFTGNVKSAAIPEIKYSGEFYVDVLRADNRAFEALVSEKIKEAGDKASAPLRIEADVRGDQLTVFSAPAATEIERQHISVIKDLVSLWLFPLRTDTVGSFEARFEPLPPVNGFSQEQKIKLGYRNRGPAVPEVLSSLHIMRWDPAIRLPAEVKGSESTRMGAPPSALIAKSRYSISFKSQEKIPGYNAQFLSSLNQLDDLKLNPQQSKQNDHPDYAKLNWNTLMRQLQTLAQLDGGAQLEVFGDLLRYLRMHPEKIADLASLLRDPSLLKLGSSAPLFKTLVGTLATLGSPEALAALRDAYEEPTLSAAAKGTILAAMTTTQATMDAATREFLAQKMQAESDPHLSQGAAFALGSALQNAANDEQAARSISLIEESWRAQRDGNRTSEQLVLLDVMGNSGRAEFFSELQAVISSEGNPSLRARAVYSLRFMNNEESTQEMILRLTDSEPLVREAAAGAMELARWHEAFRRPLETCSSSDSLSRIQDACRKVLSQNGALADSR